MSIKCATQSMIEQAKEVTPKGGKKPQMTSIGHSRPEHVIEGSFVRVLCKKTKRSPRKFSWR